MMLGTAMLMTMCDYNAATNAHLLTLAAHLSDEQLDAPSGYSQGSLRQTLVHYLVVEWVWRSVVQDHARPTAMPPIIQAPTVAGLQAFAAEEAIQLRALIDGQSEDALQTPFATERGGQMYQIVPWQGLMQLLMHSGQHRSEVAAMLTSYGQSPGDIDILFFTNPEMRPLPRS